MASPADAERATRSTSTAGTSHTVSGKTTSTPSAGDTLIIVFRAATACTTTWPAGYDTFLVHDATDDASDDVVTIVVRKATGSESTTITVTSSVSTKMAAVTYWITGAADPTVTSPEISTVATGNSVNPDPGSRSVTGGPKDILALALDTHAGEQTSTVTYPTNYVNTGQITSGSGGAVATNCQINFCSRQVSAASSEDPSAFTISGAQDWAAYTIVVHPGSSSTPLTIQAASHAHAADNVVLTQHNVLAVQAASHAHVADNVGLGVALFVQDAAHAHVADGPLSLIQHHVLAIQEALHAHAADSLVLTQHNVLAIQAASHAHTADNLALIQHHVLAIADALHAHGADNVVLSLGGSTLLVIQNGSHEHTADGLVLGVGLVVADAAHGHIADGVALTQHNILAIHDALHAQTADNVVLSIPGEEGGAGYVVRLRRRHSIS